uniref:Uncharacterized protein n=2 Tax=unclassified Kuttervirus TaxID=2770329 RepID=A0AAU8GHW1_9CAUD
MPEPDYFTRFLSARVNTLPYSFHSLRFSASRESYGHSWLQRLLCLVYHRVLGHA